MDESIGNEVIGAAITIDDTYNTLAVRYAKDADTTPEDQGGVLATLKAAITKGLLEVIVGNRKQAGRMLGLLADGGEGDTVEETAYIVRRVEYTADDVTTVSMVLEPIYTAVHTQTANEIPSEVGVLTGYYECSVSVTSTGLLEARVGVGPAASTGTPGTIEIPDIGPGVQGIVRIFKSDSATSVRPRTTIWE